MKKLLSVLIAVLLMMPLVAAQDEEVKAGILPSSFLWGIDRAIEKIQLLLTFDVASKAERRLLIAEERLAEVKAMIEQNRLDHAEEARLLFVEEIHKANKLKQSIVKEKVAGIRQRIQDRIDLLISDNKGEYYG